MTAVDQKIQELKVAHQSAVQTQARAEANLDAAKAQLQQVITAVEAVGETPDTLDSSIATLESEISEELAVLSAKLS